MPYAEREGTILRSLLSYFFALLLGLLVVAPNIPYKIPLIINSFSWCYLVVVSGLISFCTLRTTLPLPLKILALYLFGSCFISQSPYLSFNANILVATTLWLFLFLQRCDFRIIVNVLEAAFWLEFILAIFQLTGYDRLLNFGAAFTSDFSVRLLPMQPSLFLGTVMQYMRFASLLAILSPFLVLRSRWYLIPIGILCLLSRSSSFAVSLIAGVAYYCLVSVKSRTARLIAIFLGLLAVLGYAAYDWGSFRGAILPENGGRLYSWGVTWITWFTDTSLSNPPPFTGPFNWQWFLFGHGTDTFLPLFPVYKHDANPFGQVHNDWLQFLWEIGLVGFSLITGYVASLVKRLYAWQRHDLIAGSICVGTNMFFAFPTRMTQTMFLIVAWLAYCEHQLRVSQAESRESQNKLCAPAETRQRHRPARLKRSARQRPL